MDITSKYSGIVTSLGKYIGTKRLRHSLYVAECAAGLCEQFAPSKLEQGVLAGLLHDNAKRMDRADLIREAAIFDIEVTSYDRLEPSLLHGKIGAALLPARFGIEDAEIRRAISDHVTGNRTMGTLSEILFVADQASVDRDFPGVEQLRNTAKRDLKLAVWMVARFKLAYVLNRGKQLIPETLHVYNSYMPAKIPDSLINTIHPVEIKAKHKSGGKN